MTRALDALLFVFLLAVAGLSGTQRVEWNFDAVPYVGAAVEWTGTSPVDTHRIAWAEVKEAVDKRTWRALSDGSRNRRRQAADPDFFHERVALSRNKVGYVLAVAGFRSVGFNGALATWWISLGSMLAVGVVVRGWLGRTLPAPMASLAAGSLLLVHPFHWFASISNPDPFAAVPTLGGLALIAAGRSRIGLALLALSLTIRFDQVLLVAPVLAWLLFRADERRRVGPGVAVAVAGWAGAVYVGLRALGGGGLLETLAHAFGDPLTLGGYLQGLWKELQTPAVRFPPAVGLFALIAAVVAALPAVGDEARAERALLGACWLFAVLHFFAFPSLRDRFFLAPMAVTMVCLVLSAWRLRAAEPRS